MERDGERGVSSGLDALSFFEPPGAGEFLASKGLSIKCYVKWSCGVFLFFVCVSINCLEYCVRVMMRRRFNIVEN